ncbi:hypothetical protein CANARDRAFT_6441 [[Candida] arabinofermentans NRRL YB-2248]|uniref:ICE2-domain-containing protein n=1 Tax=[Candida] arabinofermentans NRRL YB-2248 TaxID=983967 RepID=A0A1E4T573_9ASCO|nr:hypothetical protein CANARDRAFT_6441 [[Candida] arabinofermentans NRRL YB-2248]
MSNDKYMDGFIQFIRIILSTVYLTYIILTIPLSFQIGGINCGLSYSITILLIYFSLTTLRICNYHRYRLITSFLYYLQHLFLPSLLSLFLTIYTTNEEYTIINKDSVFYKVWYDGIIIIWKFFLMNSTPLFTILEGFCSLLSIQAIGQFSKIIITKKKSDLFLILNLIVSSCILSCCFYFISKIYISNIDLQISLISASLFGSCFTLLLLILIFGIYFNKASTLECSLICLYIIKCCYELIPKLSENNFQMLFDFIFNEFKNLDLYKFEKSTSFINDERFFILKSFESLWNFLKISINNLTLSILIQLAYRIMVFFAATKIIPILNNNNNNQTTKTTTSDSHFIKLIYLYSPCIIIAVYTNLMIQYIDDIDNENYLLNLIKLKTNFNLLNIINPWKFWNWINIFTTLILYFLELLSHNPDDNSIANHWVNNI